MLQGKNFAYLNFDENRLLEKWDEDLAMSALDETMRWKNISPDREEQAAQVIMLADDYMRNGGYLETIPARGITKNYLSTLFDSILLKDVAKRHNVRNTTDLYNLATYLLSNFCNPISANEFAGELPSLFAFWLRAFACRNRRITPGIVRSQHFLHDCPFTQDTALM